MMHWSLEGGTKVREDEDSALGFLKCLSLFLEANGVTEVKWRLSSSCSHRDFGPPWVCQMQCGLQFQGGSCNLAASSRPKEQGWNAGPPVPDSGAVLGVGSTG